MDAPFFLFMELRRTGMFPEVVKRRVIGPAEYRSPPRFCHGGVGKLLGVPEYVRRFGHAAANAGAAVASGLMIVVKYGM